MALQVADRIQQTGTANTTVSFTLSATTVGYQAFSPAITTGNTTYYSANDGTNWEVGIGTLTNSTTLTRTVILSSSNSGSAVSTFGATVTIFCDYPSGKSVIQDSNGNVSNNTFFDAYSNTAAAGTTTTLTASSIYNYVVTGSGGQTFKLPDATTLPSGAIYTFNNNQSSGTIVVQNNSSTTVVTIQSGGFVELTLLSNAIAAGSWDTHYEAPSNVSWSTNTFDYAGSITSATWNGAVVAYNRGGTGLSSVGTSGNVLTSNGSAWVSQAPSPTSSSYTRSTQTATSGQTTFSVTYTVPYIAVYLNGVLLNAVDYTATNGTTVVLTTGATVGDLLDFISFTTSSIAVAGGSNTQVQYNSGGNLAGNAAFTFTGNDLNIPFGTSNSATSSAKIALALSMIA